MNASLWQLAGWTMIHSLWLGAAVALAGGFLRLACRRATPNARYAISLATLALLAAAPIAAAGWLSINGVPQLAATSPSPRYSGERLGEGQNDQGTWPSRNAGATNENPFLSPPLPGTDLSDLQSSTSQIIDLANPNSSPQPSGTWSGEGFAALPATPHAKVTIGNPSPTSSALPLPPSDHQSPITSHLSPLIPYLPTLWLIGAPLTFTLLATGLVGSERLRRRATPLTAGPAFDACDRLRQTLKITRRVALAVCDDVAQPILVGIIRPLILLPTAALAGWTPEQLDMVLLHELAHVRRWDNLVNLLQRIVESLLFFHPAVWLVSRQVRRDREECCDAAVIRHTDRPHQYAELLVSIAAALRGGPAPSLAVASAMASHPLAGRIRRILNIEAEPMRITRRTLAATLLLPLLLAGAIFYSGASAEDSPPVKPGNLGSPNQGGAATGSISEETQSTAKASSGSAAPVQEPEPSAKSGENETAPENDADSYAANYPIKPDTQIDLFDLVRSLGGHNLKLDMVAGEWVITLNAPKQAHNRLKVLLGDSTLPQPAAPPSNNMAATASSRPSDDQNASVDIANLKKEIRNLTNLIAKAQKEIIDSEVAKELAIWSVGNAELETDPTISLYKSQLSELQAAVEATKATSKPDISQLNRLSDTIQKVETDLAKYRSEAERSVREKLAKMPNETLRATIAKYNLRRMGAEVELAEYQQQLLHSKQKLAEANAQLGVPQAIGTYATPMIAAAGAIQRQIENQNPTANASPNVGASAPPSQSDSNSPQADLRTVLAETKDRLQRQLADLKARAAEAEGTEAERAAASALEAKVLEWEVMNKAREALSKQRAAAAGSSTNAAGGPGSPNRGSAATRSNVNDAQHTANASANAVPLAQKPETPANDSANTPVDSASPTEQEAEKLRRLFQVSPSNEMITKFYAVPQESRQEYEPGIGVFISELLGTSKSPFHLEWKPGEDGVYVTAPELAHRGYFNVVFAAHKLSQFDYPPDAELPDYQAALAEVEKAQADAARAMEGLPPAHLPPAHFPTLENQKIADRAYKLLGVEFEPLKPQELERVKKLGYPGGLRVANNEGSGSNLPPDALLVGLHAWPVTDLGSLGAILDRDDLSELAPLKFYVIRNPERDQFGGVDPAKDYVATGRLQLMKHASDRASQDKRAGNAATFPNGPVPPADNAAAVTVVQPPVSSISGPTKNHTQTTAYLKISFKRLPSPFDDADIRLTPKEIELQAKNCLAIAKSPSVLRAALQSFTPQDAQEMWQDQAVEALKNRLSATFPGDGEILELKLEGGDAKEDSALLQAVIDAFIAVMKASPASPADPNAAAVPPGDLNRYIGRDVTPAPAIADYQHPALFAEALERSRKSNKPVIVHLLALNSDPSEQFANEILADPQVADFIHKNFDAITIYPEDHPAFAKKFHINRVPADMFIYAGGERIAGGVTPPATPELYLAHLKTHHKLATSTAIQNGDAPLVPAAPIAPVASRPDGANAATESDQPTFLYDGKTFDQWRDLWKLELNPERRTEAVNALAAFGRTGRGDEAISAILDVAAEYDFSRIDDSKPEGRLKERVIEALAPEDVTNAEDQWLPLLLSRLKSDPPKWDPLLIQLLARTGPPYRASFVLTPDNLKLLKQAAADPAYGPNARLVNHLYWSAPEDKEVAQLVKATLTGADAANAVELLRNIGYRRIDEYPEKLELLFHSDPAIRRLARTALYHSIDPGTHDAVTAKLLAIVADPKQADRHADAIRAIAAIVKRAGDKPNPGRPTLSKETIQAIADGLTPILAEGSAELIPPAFLVADKVRRTANFKNKLVDFLSNPPEDRMAPVEAALKASPDEESALIDQPEHGGGVDGSGGGFF